MNIEPSKLPPGRLDDLLRENDFIAPHEFNYQLSGVYRNIDEKFLPTVEAAVGRMREHIAVCRFLQGWPPLWWMDKTFAPAEHRAEPVEMAQMLSTWKGWPR